MGCHGPKTLDLRVIRFAHPYSLVVDIRCAVCKTLLFFTETSSAWDDPAELGAHIRTLLTVFALN